MKEKRRWEMVEVNQMLNIWVEVCMDVYLSMESRMKEQRMLMG